ncbi:MAG: 50S ribosomal protein L31 [Coriobacteriaceae bacterium]|nr:50S ribosomal protein L31 [Coriobacteriaceae bacterium]
MKKDIHPNYIDCTVKCSCGNTFQTRSTKPELKIDICNTCHPFFTGQQKFIDTGGRVQRFADRFGSAKEAVAAREAAKKAERAAELEAIEAKKKAEREAKAAEKAARAASFAAKAEKEARKAAAAEAIEDEGISLDATDLDQEVTGSEPVAVSDASAPEADAAPAAEAAEEAAE